MNRIRFLVMPSLCGVGLFSLPQAENTWSEKWEENWDHRGHLKLKEVGDGDDGKVKASGRRVHRIYLVRHGQYVHGKTDEDKMLTDLGREQAKVTGQRLKKLLDNMKDHPPLKKVVYSTMTRATETCQLMLPYLLESKSGSQLKESRDIVACSMIREGACCKPEPPIAYERWPVTEEDFFKDGQRIEAGFRNYIYRPDPNDEKDSTSVLVCHGNVIRYIVCRALQISPDKWLRMAVYNASYTVLDVYDNGRVSLKSLGEVGHFEDSKMVTYQ